MAPLQYAGDSLFEHAGFRFALFPRRGGHAPEPGDLDQLYRFGQLLGRLHAIGASRPFVHREALTVDSFGRQSLATLQDGGFIPQALRADYGALAETLLARLDALFAGVPHRAIRLHGDCHPGNLLYRDERFHIVDLDDCRMGPAVQDLWMLLAGDRHERQRQLGELIDGYNEFHDFAPRELALIEGLRSLRLSLQRLAGAPLGRPGLPAELPLVRQRALLARAGGDASRTARRPRRGTAAPVLTATVSCG